MVITALFLLMPAVLVWSRSSGMCFAWGARPDRHSWAERTSIRAAPEDKSSFASATETVVEGRLKTLLRESMKPMVFSLLSVGQYSRVRA